MSDNFCVILATIWFVLGAVFGFIFENLEHFRMAMIIGSIYTVGHIIVLKINEK